MKPPLDTLRISLRRIKHFPGLKKASARGMFWKCVIYVPNITNKMERLSIEFNLDMPRISIWRIKHLHKGKRPFLEACFESVTYVSETTPSYGRWVGVITGTQREKHGYWFSDISSIKTKIETLIIVGLGFEGEFEIIFEGYNFLITPRLKLNFHDA